MMSRFQCPADLIEDEEDYEGSSDDDDSTETLPLGISESLAKSNLAAAGTLVDEAPEKITVAGNRELLSDEVQDLFEKILKEVNLPYEPAEFQRVSVNVIGKNYSDQKKCKYTLL